MSKQYFEQLCATDHDIFSLLTSGKQRLTDNTLNELAKDRGIFFSPKSSRSDLIEEISIWTHDYYDIVGLIEKRDYKKRNEKMTSVILPIELSVDEMKGIVKEYKEDGSNKDKVTSHQKGNDAVVINTEYDEYDYSKTRLIQRQRKDASIHIESKDGQTIIRLPASEKAINIVETLKDKVEAFKKTVVPLKKIEVDNLLSPEERNSFFLKLISDIDGFDLLTVTNLKVDRFEDGDLSEEDDEDDLAIKQSMIGVVESAVFSGQNLVASEQYVQLINDGFFITSITWRAQQKKDPFHLVQFETSFENGKLGTGFKYSAKYSTRIANSTEYTKHFKPSEGDLKFALLSLIEASARKALDELSSTPLNEE
ncbi:hypothetical protein [Acinetobacter baumannii]|uniref:hypothetical protein n=1 Tax=Acinetobacter baumannii TaxID=470 RepID=UPI00385D5F3C